MPDELETLKKQISVLEQRLALYENDPQKNGDYVFRRILNQQVEYLKGFTIKDKIQGKASEDATYARSKDMWEGLPKMISDMNTLKKELNIDPKEEEKEFNKFLNRTTPKN